MAQVRISAEIAEELLFGFSAHPVAITNIRLDGNRREFVLNIQGQDVPPVAEVTAICKLQQNRAGQRFLTMEFQPSRMTP